MLNPYDADLDLTDKEDRKMFTEGCKGVSEKDIFDGKKQNYSNFVKLIEGDLNARRTMGVLTINTMWAEGGATDATKRIPLPEGRIDMFESNKATTKEIAEHVKLV